MPASTLALVRRCVALWQPITRALENLQAPTALLARAYVAEAFFRSGLTKIRDWDTTLALFADEYHVPLLPPGAAAVMGTAGELVLPVLLMLGLGGRFAALGLSVVNVVAVISLSEIAPAALQQHLTWGVLLAGLAIHGVGRWSLDCAVVAPALRRSKHGNKS
jgi:putative oxidoreductase